MLKRNLTFAAAILWSVSVLSLPAMTTAAKAKPAAKTAVDVREKCYECHDDIKTLKEGSKHAKLSCTICHDNFDAHMDDPENKPVTIIDQHLCGKCHKNQMESFYQRQPGGRRPQGERGSRRPLAHAGQAACPPWLHLRTQRAARSCLHGHRPVRCGPFPGRPFPVQGRLEGHR